MTSSTSLHYCPYRPYRPYLYPSPRQLRAQPALNLSLLLLSIVLIIYTMLSIRQIIDLVKNRILSCIAIRAAAHERAEKSENRQKEHVIKRPSETNERLSNENKSVGKEK